MWESGLFHPSLYPTGHAVLYEQAADSMSYPVPDRFIREPGGGDPVPIVQVRRALFEHFLDPTMLKSREPLLVVYFFCYYPQAHGNSAPFQLIWHPSVYGIKL